MLLLLGFYRFLFPCCLPLMHTNESVKACTQLFYFVWKLHFLDINQSLVRLSVVRTRKREMAATSTDLPYQQPQQQPLIYPTSLSSSSGRAWHNSGSVGPFFAVMAVLTVLTVLSCLVSRFCVSRTTTPPPDIRCGGCLWWLRRKCSRCVVSHGDIELGEELSVKKINNGKPPKGIDETAASSPSPSAWYT